MDWQSKHPHPESQTHIMPTNTYNYLSTHTFKDIHARRSFPPEWEGTALYCNTMYNKSNINDHKTKILFPQKVTMKC